MWENTSILLEKSLNLKLDDSVKHILNERSSFVNFSKGSILLRQGEYASNLFFIIKGIVRAYYIDEDGNDITKTFASENEFFSTKGLINNKPSMFTLECLEAMECIQIPYTILNPILEDNHDLFRIFTQYVLTGMGNLEGRTRDLVIKNAADRYKIFLKQYPELEQRISQKYIASYIGIRSGSLSRIKKQ